MNHYVKITLRDDADAEAIEKLRHYIGKAGGESAAAKRFMLRGMGLPDPVAEAVRQAAREVFEEVKASG